MLRLFVLSSLVFILASCSSTKLVSQPEKEPIVVDGYGLDWMEYKMVIDEDVQLALATVYNDSNLFLLIRFNNPQQARRMAARGLNLWLNKEKSKGIAYYDRHVRFNRQNDSNREKIYLPNGGFTYEHKEFSTPLNDLPDLEAAFDVQSGNYCIEYKIPHKVNLFLNSETQSHMLGLEIGKKRQNNKMKPQMQGRSKMRGGAGAMGKGSRSRGMGRARPNTGSSKQENIIWFDVIIKK